MLLVLQTSDEFGLTPYDAILLISYGGPYRSDDVMPFLHNVVAGKGIPDQRLQAVAQHYEHFDGSSPINDENLYLQQHLRAELLAQGYDVPVLIGNRNWHPHVADTLRDAAAFGVHRLLAVFTSAYACYSSSREYREMLAEVLAEFPSISVDVLHPYFNMPGFVQANEEAIRTALSHFDAPAHVVYVTHSIPQAMEEASAATGPSYVSQHESVAAELDARLGAAKFGSSMAYCSRSGRPGSPWLEPDINDRLRELSAAGIEDIVIAPIGFVADHMEVVYDLDTEAQQTAAELGMRLVRAGTANRQHSFAVGLAEICRARAARESGESSEDTSATSLDVFPDDAPAGSCRQRPDVITGLPVIAGAVD